MKASGHDSEDPSRRLSDVRHKAEILMTRMFGGPNACAQYDSNNHDRWKRAGQRNRTTEKQAAPAGDGWSIAKSRGSCV
jgi:hypothetical protein